MTQLGQPDQHRRPDLAGVGAAQLVMDVLGADADASPGRRWPQRIADGGEADERRADDPLDVGHLGPGREQCRPARPRRPASVCIFQFAAMTTGRIGGSCQSRPTR